MKFCNKCKQWKDEFGKGGSDYYCRECRREAGRKYRENNREIINKRRRERDYKNGAKPMSENKECSMYLGRYINERILKHVMPNAVLMDINNPGYDLVCGKGYLVDAKASVLRYPKIGSPIWQFKINKNKTPDHFLLTAYKDRETLDICHMWLIPGSEINDKVSVAISLSTIHKWDQYKIDHMDALSCVNQMKASA